MGRVAEVWPRDSALSLVATRLPTDLKFSGINFRVSVTDIIILSTSVSFGVTYTDNRVTATIWGLLKGVGPSAAGFHTAVRGAIVRDGAVTARPSRECDITFFVRGRPKSAQQLWDSTVAARRAQSVTVLSPWVTCECRSPVNFLRRNGHRPDQSHFLGDRYDWTTGVPDNGNDSAPHLACTPFVPLFCTLFKRGGSRSAFRLPGAGRGSFPLYGGTFARSYSVSTF